MKVKVKLLKGGREEAVEVRDGTMCVLDFKMILQELFMIPAAEQSLVFRGKALSDSRDLSSYEIKDGAKLFLSQKSGTAGVREGGRGEAMETDGGRVSLTVKLLQGGREEIIEVDSEQVTVAEVKKVIEAKCGVSAHLQSLVVGGRALEASYKLSDYGIKSGDKLFLAQKSPSPTPPPPSQPLPSPARNTRFCLLTQAYLSRHFSYEEVVQIVTRMEQDLRRHVYEVNLDSIETLAAKKLSERP